MPEATRLPNLTWRQAISWRLRRQHLDQRLPRTKLLPLASHLCGLHAQVMSSAELTALCRIDDLRPDDVSKALWKDRKLVKTWAMRATLHLLPSAEYGKWLHAFAHYDRARSEAWYKYFGITAEELVSITEAVGEAIRGRTLTREQLSEEVIRLTGLPGIREKLRMGWGSLLKPACYRGLLRFEPNKGQHAQFTNPEVAPEESPGFAARKYFAAYGPATTDDFHRWLHTGRAYARKMVRELGDELAEVDIEGTSAWMLRKEVRAAQKAEPVQTVRLLPAFDQYVFAAANHTGQLLPNASFRPKIYRTQGWYSAVLLVDGDMDGVWKFARNSSRVEIVIEPFGKVPARVRKSAEAEAERIAQYMGKPLELRWVQ